jgi:hypothetical protein
LNSPDIEFDTTVQTYDTENLHLRIIGAVPITANVSAHHITASSERGITPGGISGSYELNKNVYHQNSSSRQNGSNRLVADTLWNDIWIGSIKKNEDGTEDVSMKYEYKNKDETNVPFTRIARITGYLTSSVDRWNNAKRSELADRVKHGICPGDDVNE